MYKSNYPTYLVHFNKNHDPKNGQFAEGDGDGDGIVDDRHYNSKFENRSEKYAMGRAKKGEAQGYHRAENFLKYPYYIDQRGYKHYYNTIFDLPRGEKGRAFVENLGKTLLLPVEFGVAVKTLADDDRDLRNYWGGWTPPKK